MSVQTTSTSPSTRPALALNPASAVVGGVGAVLLLIAPLGLAWFFSPAVPSMHIPSMTLSFSGLHHLSSSGMAPTNWIQKNYFAWLGWVLIIATIVITGADRRIVGILSERDIMNRVVAVGRTPGTTAVSEVMTANPRAVAADESIEECLFIMREFGFRHLPIVDGKDGKDLKGLVSLRDVLMHQAAELERQARKAAS